MNIYFKDMASVSRMTTTSGKSSLEDTGNSYLGYIRPNTKLDTVQGNKFGHSYSFSTRIDADIKEGDVLEIKGDKYKVAGIAPFRGIGLNVLKTSVIKI